MHKRWRASQQMPAFCCPMKRFASDNATIQPIVYWNSLDKHSIWFAYFRQIWILHVKHENGKTEILRLRCETFRVFRYVRTFWQIKRM